MWICPKCNTSNWDDVTACSQCHADWSARLDLYLMARRPDDRPFYSVTLAPGTIRYVRSDLFTRVEPDQWVAHLKQISENPNIEGPWGSAPDTVNPVDVTELVGEVSWESKCRILHGFEILFRDYEIPSTIYCSFHSALKLRSLEFAECIDSWVINAWKDPFVVKSYIGSNEHLVLNCLPDLPDSEISRLAVFKKTPFVIQQLDEALQSAEAAKVAENLEQLRRSKFTTYVYIMEDLRNGLFKIGQSETPEKREKTLQSEVPEVSLRFYIPAHDNAESELHDRFAAKRVRGEWFGLTPQDVLFVIRFLKENGDLDRVSVEHEWIGKIAFAALETGA